MLLFVFVAKWLETLDICSIQATSEAYSIIEIYFYIVWPARVHAEAPMFTFTYTDGRKK